MPAHVRKGDQVMITSGSLKGRIGEILRVMPATEQVIVKGLNLRTKNLRPTQRNPRGGVITKEAPLHMSKVSPVVDGKPVRVGFRVEKDGGKVRVARHGGKDLKVLGVVRKAK
ncbi:MAG: 50S ribosomal protein L24 [Phycisphaeraceae bacterium]|nr:50S ribosomal protein L24 [Phycisphaerae bacterium]MBX3391380.1 50S ribosomal protein L24 [Phycisphaeraceae bacterium]HRJ49459.1 50S ribosomal protein L24 [Phycisphaerales bacterium]